MKQLLSFTAAVEGATGLALMGYPPLVTLLLLGHRVSGPGTALGRVAGFALLSLGLACWPAGDVGGWSPSHRAMLTYNLLVALYLLRLGIGGEFVGKLLWPAFVLHAVLTMLLACVSLNNALRPSKAELVN
jgi:hypothetical protein